MLIVDLIRNRCPNCRQGKVFENSNLLTLRPVKMNDQCPACHLNFKKEPGFYWGSMYASYGLALMEGFVAYFICRLFGTDTFDMINLYIVIAVMILMSPFNFRMARLIWLYILPGNV